MKIGLMGLEFDSANKGCEALVYSFLSIINNIGEDDLTIYNFSGTSLGCVDEVFPNMKFVNVYPKIKDFKFKYLRALRQCNFIFDATMGDSFSDIYSKDYFKHLAKHKRLAAFLCKKYVLLPQTYGPFSSTESQVITKKILNSAYKIYCRDELSQTILKEKFGINNSLLVSDMAFILPYKSNLYTFSNKEKIGINISGLLYKGGFHSKNQFDLSLNYPELIDKLIDKLSKNYEVHLISHVIDKNENAYDDDYKISKKLSQKYKNVFLAPAFETPIEAKSYISNMDIFIGSRMHSTIAAFSSNVITIPISYSRKFEGLFGSLEYPFVVNARAESTDSAYNTILDYINRKSELKATQKISISFIEEKNKKFQQSIMDLLKEK